VWDLRWGLPFPNDRIAEIRSDHFFEHLELPDVVRVLTECRRVLQPGAILDFTVPHIDPYIDVYLAHDLERLTELVYSVPEGQEVLYGTCMDRLAWLLLRDGSHRSMFDRESILHKVRLVGFSSVSTRDYQPDRDLDRRYSSIYVVAVK